MLKKKEICVDLDGNLLINNDPYHGVVIKDGRLKIAVKDKGLGLSLINKNKGLL